MNHHKIEADEAWLFWNLVVNASKMRQVMWKCSLLFIMN